MLSHLHRASSFRTGSQPRLRGFRDLGARARARELVPPKEIRSEILSLSLYLLLSITVIARCSRTRRSRATTSTTTAAIITVPNYLVIVLADFQLPFVPDLVTRSPPRTTGTTILYATFFFPTRRRRVRVPIVVKRCAVPHCPTARIAIFFTS